MLLWILAVVVLVWAIFWDDIRWRWPFLPKGIEEQISAGERILAGASQDPIKEWQDRCYSVIEESWGRRSQQRRQFKEAAEPPDIADNFSYGEVEILREQVRALKNLKAV